MVKNEVQRMGLAALLGAFVVSGCHTYVPVETPNPGAPVRVTVPARVSVEGSRRPTQAAEFEGTVLSVGDSMLLETYIEQIVDGRRTDVPLDTLRIPITEIGTIEERVFSTSRTVLLSAALVGGTVALVGSLSGALSGDDDDGDNPGGGDDTTSFRVSEGFWRGVPIFGIRIPLSIPWL